MVSCNFCLWAYLRVGRGGKRPFGTLLGFGEMAWPCRTYGSKNGRFVGVDRSQMIRFFRFWAEISFYGRF